MPLSMLEMGRLYLERGDTLKSLSILTPLATELHKAEKFDLYLDTVQLLLRANTEILDFTAIDKYHNKLHQLVETHAISLTPKMLYTSGLCFSHRNQHQKALELCQQALALAIKHDDQEGMSHAILGTAISYYNLNQLQDSLKEIYNLQIVMNILELPQVRLSSQILKGHILRKLKKYDQALDILWQCFEMLKTEKNLSVYISLLYGVGLTHKEAGRIEDARNYLKLAKKSIDPLNLKRLSALVEKLLVEIGVEESSETYDLIFDPQTHLIREKNLGKIDLQNQFILIDLLSLFISKPGYSFTKEQIVKLIWKQSYNPAVHDNKIYVTIKRLRQVLEPNMEKPKYIFRSKYGYYFSQEAKILIENNKEQNKENI